MYIILEMGIVLMTNDHFDTICNITQEPQELQRYNRACGFILQVWYDEISIAVNVSMGSHMSNS